MKKVVMVIAHETFRDEELLEPQAILAKQGITVSVASTSLSPATGKLGAKVKPDILLKDVSPDAYDAVVFVGGGGATLYFDDPVAHRLIQDAYAQGKIVAAICIAPVILAKAGILKGKRATCWFEEGDTLTRLGVSFTGALVEKEGTILTANGPAAAKAFALALVEMLK